MHSLFSWEERSFSFRGTLLSLGRNTSLSLQICSLRVKFCHFICLPTDASLHKCLQSCQVSKISPTCKYTSQALGAGLGICSIPNSKAQYKGFFLHAAFQKQTGIQPMTTEDGWIETPVAQRTATHNSSSPEEAPPRPQHDPSAHFTEDKTIDPTLGVGNQPLSGASSEARAGSAGSGDKAVRRMTEAERLLTLWAGDK